MNCLLSALVLASSLAALSVAHAQVSLLRVSCEGDDVGAEVTLNGKFKGECPLDIQAGKGTMKLRVVKKVDTTHERVFEREYRIGDGVVKKVEVVLSAPMPIAQPQSREGANPTAESKAVPKPAQDRLPGLADKQRRDEEVLTKELNAAEEGNARAMAALGARYERGKGVPKDNFLAAYWYFKAITADDTSFSFGNAITDALNRVTNRMPPTESRNAMANISQKISDERQERQAKLEDEREERKAKLEEKGGALMVVMEKLKTCSNAHDFACAELLLKEVKRLAERDAPGKVTRMEFEIRWDKNMAAAGAPASSSGGNFGSGGVPMQVTGGGNKDTGTSVGQGSTLSGANMEDPRKGYVKGTNIRCDPIACVDACPQGMEKLGKKCVLKIRCLKPAVLQNGRCVRPDSTAGAGEAPGGGAGGNTTGGGFDGQDAKSCIVIAVNSNNTSQTITNRCPQTVSLVFCLTPSLVSRKIGIDCGHDNRYFQQFTDLKQGEVYENSYTMRLGETFEYGACFGRTQQTKNGEGEAGTYSCLPSANQRAPQPEQRPAPPQAAAATKALSLKDEVWRWQRFDNMDGKPPRESDNGRMSGDAIQRSQAEVEKLVAGSPEFKVTGFSGCGACAVGDTITFDMDSVGNSSVRQVMHSKTVMTRIK